MVLVTAVFKPLIDLVGFGWAVRIIAFIILICLLFALAVLRQRPSPTMARNLLDLNAFRELRFNIFALAMFFLFAGLYTPFFFIAVFGQQKVGLSQNMSYNMLAIMGVGSIFGRILPGFAAQKYGGFPVCALFVFTCGMLQFIWGSVHNLGGLVAFSFFYGFFGGGVAGIAPVVCMELAPTMQLVGTRMGMLLFIAATGILVGNPIAGAILNTKSQFEGVEVFSGAILLVGSILVIVTFELILKYRRSLVAPAA
jgi:predicted MFS family arabinose efflux permease